MPTDYSSLAAANPYKNQPYKKTLFQRVLSGLGFRTQADAWNENMSVQAAEYDAALKQKQFDNEYNTPVAEASRMRQAGLNPDLQGLGDVAESAPMGEDPSTPMQSTGDEQTIFNAAHMILDAATTGLGLASQFGQLRALGISNDAGQIANSERVSQFSKWLFDNTQLAFDPNQSEEDRFHEDFLRSESIANQIRLPKRFRRQFRQSLSHYYGSLEQQANLWDKTKQTNSDKLDVARQFDSKFFGDGSFESMKIVNKGLVSLSDALAEYVLKSGKSENEFKSEYFDNLSGSERAAAENSAASNERIYNEHFNPVAAAQAVNAESGSRKVGAEYQSMMTGIDKIVNKSLSDIVHGLNRRANRGDIFAQSMLFSFALARMSSISIGPQGLSFGLKPR